MDNQNNNIGQPYTQPQQYQVPQPQYQQPYQPQYQYSQPEQSIPGEEFSIASLVIGIVSIFYTMLAAFAASLGSSLSGGGIRYRSQSLDGPILGALIIGIIAIIFGVIDCIRRKYAGGKTIVGVILGLISTCASISYLVL